MWLYESRQSWRALWGPVDDPPSKDGYPDRWRVWGDEFLAPLIVGDPDDIDYTAYHVFPGGDER